METREHESTKPSRGSDGEDCAFAASRHAAFDDDDDDNDDEGRRVPTTTNENSFERGTVLDGMKLLVQSQQFRSAKITAVLSGVTLDLRDAVLSPEGATISVQSAMSGIDILVPGDWHVVCEIDAVMSGVDGGSTRAGTAGRGPRLTVTGVVVAGGLSVR